MKKNVFILVFSLFILIIVAMFLLKRTREEVVSPDVFIEEERQEHLVYWWEREEIFNFEGRVYETRPGEIDLITTISRDDKKESIMVTVFVTEDTKVERAEIIEDEETYKLVREKGSFTEVLPGMVVSVYSKQNIRAEKKVEAKSIDYKPGTETDWLNQFEGIVAEVISERELVVKIIVGENIVTEAEAPVSAVTEVRLMTTEQTKQIPDLYDLSKGDAVRVSTDRSILHETEVDILSLQRINIAEMNMEGWETFLFAGLAVEMDKKNESFIITLEEFGSYEDGYYIDHYDPATGYFTIHKDTEISLSMDKIEQKINQLGQYPVRIYAKRNILDGHQHWHALGIEELSFRNMLPQISGEIVEITDNRNILIEGGAICEYDLWGKEEIFEGKWEIILPEELKVADVSRGEREEPNEWPQIAPAELETGNIIRILAPEFNPEEETSTEALRIWKIK